MNIEELIKKTDELHDDIMNVGENEIDIAFQLQKEAFSKAWQWNKIAISVDRFEIEGKKYTKSEFRDFCHNQYQLLKIAHHIAKDIWKKSEIL